MDVEIMLLAMSKAMPFIIRRCLQLPMFKATNASTYMNIITYIYAICAS